MKKKTIIGLFVFSVLIILFSLNIQASIYSTIGMKGLSFVDSNIIGTIQTATQITGYPKAVAGNYVTKQITGEAMQLIAEEAPKAAQSIQQYNQVKGWINEGAQITEDLKLTEKGEFAGGSIVIEKKQNMESLTKEAIGEAENIELSTKGEGEPFDLEAKKDGASVNIGGKNYPNLKKGSTMTAGREGEVIKADVTFTKATTIELGGKQISVEKDTRVTYEDGILSIEGEGKTVELDGQKIGIGKGGILVSEQTIIGDFTLDEKKFSGEVTLVEEGYLLKGTMETKRMTVTTSEEEVLFSKSCQDVSGFNNYVSPCRGTLTMAGSVGVQLKEGRNFGLNIPKGAELKLELDGAKVTLENGLADIKVNNIGDNVKITNGELKTKHARTDEGIEVTTNADSIGGEPDIELTTATGVKGVSCVIETNKEGFTVLHCPEDSSPTTQAIAYLTGQSFKETCASIVNSAKGKLAKAGILKGEPATLSDDVTVYPQTLKQVSMEEAGGKPGDCVGCEYYKVKTDKGTIYLTVAPIGESGGMAGYTDEEGNRHILSDEDERKLGLGAPTAEYSEEETTAAEKKISEDMDPASWAKAKEEGYGFRLDRQAGTIQLYPPEHPNYHHAAYIIAKDSSCGENCYSSILDKDRKFYLEDGVFYEKE